ncbi:hypothetical protein AOLI_G00180360 [Acnodon oligacanthus]
MKQHQKTMIIVQFDEPPCVPMSEDILNESLLKERLKKKYQDFDTTYYAPLKVHLFKTTDEDVKSKKMIEGLKWPINDFLKAGNVIEYVDLFKPCPITNKDVRTVLMKGIPGIGKTTAVKKFVLDWTEGRTQYDITFVLPFNLTELRLMKPEKCNLVQLLGLFFPELTDVDALQHSLVLFVLDDLSKCKLTLNFWNTKSCSDPKKELSLRALLVNLLRGDLFPKAQIWGKVEEDLTPSEWSAMAKTLLNSEDPQSIFDIRGYLNPDVVFLRLLPVIKASKVLRLCESEDLSWMLLASALRSPSNSITEIDVEDHHIMEKHTILLCEGLKSLNCKVEVLRTPLHYYDGNGDPDPLISALLSNPSHLRELNLSKSYAVSDKTVECLAKILVDSACYLEKLVLCNNIRMSVASFKTLAKALCSSNCCLKELDLSSSYGLRDDKSAVPHLSKGLGDPCSQIRVLRLASCSVDHTGVLALVSALSSNPSHLRELDLSYSRPGLHAFLRFCSLLKDPRFKLETLILVNTNWWEDDTPSGTSTCRRSLTDIISDACKALASALSSSNLRVLDLSINSLEDSSVELLSAGLSHSACQLEILRMARCKITEVGASTLANALRLNPSHMRELDLSYNPVEGTGLNQLNSLVGDPAIKLEKIIVDGLGEKRDIERLRQHEFSLTLDPNTASVDVEVSKGDKKSLAQL